MNHGTCPECRQPISSIMRMKALESLCRRRHEAAYKERLKEYKRKKEQLENTFVVPTPIFV